ncbi:SDR family NAD(P)-dependent oxidoreductase [Pseudomonas guariconensis]|uniref:SDR family NAD(P)-dependent oxidoreductase n=1 Tax=Pseudomonas guariconensis TaxID=1288410 RepID=UPI0018A9EA9F|nr:SDR family oxidoreductase [Pseudomonas guariconensis]MBF8755408.1 SDR family oxidoreductase [Pseudomonas guariconensis]
MSQRLAGKAALVLGVAPGNVGEAIARRYVEHGARVMIAGRRVEALEAVGAALDVPWQVCDIISQSEVDALVASSAQRFGGLDIGVNATGWGLLKPFLEHSQEDLDRMNAVQFTGPFQYFQALLRHMPQGGSIIQISSVTASIMFDDHAAYMGTKAGMDHVVRCIAHEFGHRGIRANSIAPGGLADAPMSGGGLQHPAIAALYHREIPLQRSGVAAEVADAALWLAGDESSFVTGQVIHVSGGQTLRRNPSLGEVYAAATGMV